MTRNEAATSAADGAAAQSLRTAGATTATATNSPLLSFTTLETRSTTASSPADHSPTSPVANHSPLCCPALSPRYPALRMALRLTSISPRGGEASTL
eukprot:m51a1_g13669 hypothetical protein (97) ;mRNA; r:1627-1995